MKKFVISIIIILLTRGGFSFTQDDFYDSIPDTEKIEMSDYYWYLYLLLDLHFEISNDFSFDNPMFFTVGLINIMKHYSDMDVIEYLWHSFDIQKTLDYLLSDMSQVLAQSDSAIHYIERNLLSLKTKKDNCDSLKELSDKEFSLALKDLNLKAMDNNLTKSLEYGQCSSDTRINYNAQDKVLWELKFYYTILNHKYEYFHRQRSNIIENYSNILYQLKGVN